MWSCTGKQVLQMMLDGDAREPAAIVEAEGWSQTTDALQVRGTCVHAHVSVVAS